MSALVLVSLFLFIVSLCGAVDPLLERVYHPLNARPCVRLLTAGGMSGCATPQNGLVGVVRAARSMSQLQALLNEVDDSNDMIAIVMDAEIAGPAAFRAAQTLKSRLAGIAIAARPASATFASTVDALTPLSLYAPSLAASTFAWNTAANSTAALLSDNYRFAVLQLSQSDTARAWRAAAENEAAIAARSFAPHAIEFQYRMGAQQNSTACLAEGSCMPLGGWSVWSELSTYNASQPLLSAAADTRPLVAAVASMDALSLFHAPVPRTSSWAADQMPTPASDSVVSSLVSLLAAAEALGRSAREQMWNPAALPRRIGLFAFSAEAVGLLGSRNFLHDLSSFQCQSFIDPAAPEKGCAIPFQSDLAFTRLCSAVTSGNCFASILELRQVGWPSSYVTYNASNDVVTNSTLFAHTQPEQRASGVANAPLAAVQTAAATLSDYRPSGWSTWRSHVRVQRAATDAPSVPPGSSWAFLGANSTTPVLVLADHRREYVNQYFHSDADTIEQSVPHLCNVATLSARSLLLMAGLDASHANFTRVAANCSVVEQLIACLLRGERCQLTSTFGASDISARPTYYTSVFLPKARRFIGGLSQFIQSALAAFTTAKIGGSCSADSDCPASFQCAGVGQCVWSTTHYHAAVEPSMQFDMKSFVWRVNTSSSAAAWTESNWADDIGARLYVRESSVAAWTTLVGGALATLLVAVMVRSAQLYCRRHLKMA